MEATTITELLSLLRELKQSGDFVTRHIPNWNLLIDWTGRRSIDTFMRQLLKEHRYSYAKRLEHFGYKVFSDGGEDGMLQEIFARIGVTNKRFAEFGVAGGIVSNTHLLLYQGWSGLWIEMEEAFIQSIQRDFAKAIDAGLLTILKAFLTAENINGLFEGAGFTGEIDLLSIDVDGNDYHLCKALNVVSPRVLVIEYNASWPPPFDYILPYAPVAQPDGICYGGSLSALSKMLTKKGYTLVGTDISGVNAFFVRSDLVANHFVQAGDVMALYNPPRYGLWVGFPAGHQLPRNWTPSFEPTDD